MKKTFDYDFECSVRKAHRNIKREVLMCVFDANVADNIASYPTVQKCWSMRRFTAIRTQY